LIWLKGTKSQSRSRIVGLEGHMVDDLPFQRNNFRINESLRIETPEGRYHGEYHSHTSKGIGVSRYSISEDFHAEKSKYLRVENSETRIVKQIMSIDLKGSDMIHRFKRDGSEPSFKKYHQDSEINGHVSLRGQKVFEL
jgi:hypothetical protein